MESTPASRQMFITLDEAATVAGVSPSTVRRWIQHRDFPHLKIGGVLRFDREVVVEWLRNHQRGAA